MRALGSIDAESSFKVKDGATYYLVLKSTTTTALTADRTLTFDAGNADKTVKLRGDLDFSSAFTTSGGFPITIVATAPTSVTLPASGTIPVSGAIVDADIAAGAAIAYSKLALTGSVVNADVAAGAAIVYSKLSLTASILDADVAAGASIAYSKLDLTASVTNADITAAAGIAYSKLALAGSLVNADVNAAAAISYSKLSLTGQIVNADVNAGAAIAYSKLALTGTLVNADVSASAALALTKLATLTASKAVTTDGSGVLTASGVTDVELGYLSGVTSALQTQISARALASRTISTTAPITGGGDLSANRTFAMAKATAMVDGYLAAADFVAFTAGGAAISALTGDVTATGPGSAVATIAAGAVDLTTKVSGVLPVANGGTNANTALVNDRVMVSSGGAVVEAAVITPSRALISDGSGIPTESPVTSTELSYVGGATSNLQTQLTGKANSGVNSDITSLTGLTGPIIMGESADYTTGGYLFGETGNDTGFVSPSDGEIDVYANSVVAFKITSSGISEIAGVPYGWPGSQGAVFTALTNDGGGGLSWSDPLNRDEQRGPATTAGVITSYVVRNEVNPASSITGTQSQMFQIEQNFGTDDSGFDVASGVGFQINQNSRNKSSWENFTNLSLNSQFGNGVDAQTGVNYGGVSLAVSTSGTVDIGSVVMFNGSVSGAAGCTISDYTFMRDVSNIDNIGLYRGYMVFPTIATATGPVLGYQMQANVGTGIDYHGYLLTPTVGTLTGQLNAFHSTANVTECAGVQMFTDSSTVTTVTAGSSYTAVGISSNVGTVDFYSGARMGATLGTVANGVTIFEDLTQVTTSCNQYRSMDIHPALASLTGDYFGLAIVPNITTSTGNATGIRVDMSAITASGTKLALDVIGRSSLNGNLAVDGYFGAASPQYTPVDNGGAVGSVHQLISQMVVAASSTTANADTIGVNTASLIVLGANSTTTSGAFGLGLCSLALPVVVTTHAGSTLDHLSAVVAALTFNPASDGGTIDNCDVVKSLIVPEGGTTTMNNVRGFMFDAPFGDPGTYTWGLYVKPTTADNWMSKSLKIGGSAGTTDRVSGVSVGLEVADRAFYPTPMDTTTRDALTALQGMIVNNSTTGNLERYDGAAWQTVVAGGTLTGAGTANRVAYWTGASSLAAQTAITAARVLISDGSGLPTHSTVTTTTLGYLDATSSVQTQLNARALAARNINTTAPLTGGGDLSADRTIAMPAADGSTDGYLTQADWSIFNSKQAAGSYITALTGDITAAGPGSVAATIANLAVTNAKIANATIDLTAKVTGVLPVANGGTNSSTALSNNRVVQTSGGAIVEAAAITAARALISDANGIPTHSAVTSATLAFLDATSSVQTQINGKQASSTELTGVAALAATGLVARTGAGTYAARTITAGSSKLSVSNGGGVAGNPTVDVVEANLSLANISGLVTLTSQVTGTLPVANGGTGVTSSTGSGSVVLSTSPALITPDLGTPTALVLTSATGLPLTTGVTGVLPVANGGTNSSSALANNRIMQSNGGQIIEVAAITANRALVSNASGIPTQSATTDTQVGYLSTTTSDVQTQINGKQATISPQAFGSTPNSNGFTVSGANVTLQPADATNGGGVSTTTQSFAGVKTFGAGVKMGGGGTQATLNDYREGTVTLAFTTGIVTGGAASTTDVVCAYTLIGKQVTLHVTSTTTFTISGTPFVLSTATGALPTEIRPTHLVQGFIYATGTALTASVPAAFALETSGKVDLYKNGNEDNMVATTSYGLQPGNIITYTLL